MGASGTPSRRDLLRDGGMIGAVAVLLSAIHVLLPAGARSQFAFDHGTPDPVTVFTSAFVHMDGSHLLGNVSGYLAAAALAYGLTVRSGRERWFRVTFVSFLLLMPFAVGLSSYALFTWQFPWIDPITRGFSGVGAGFVGFVFVALLAGLRDTHGGRPALFVGLAVWLLLLLEIYVIYAGRLTLPVAGAVSVGWGVSLWGLLGEFDLVGADWSRRLPGIARVCTVVALLAVFVTVLFPSRIVTDGAVTNVFAHAIGLLYGMAGATLIHEIIY